MPLVFTTSYTEDARAIFRQYKKPGAGDMAQAGWGGKLLSRCCAGRRRCR